MSLTTAQLESSLKETLQTLTQILTFYSSVQSLSATPYASNAPRALTDKLGKCTADYQKACDELEAKVLRALAVLERDSRKENGLEPLQPPTPVAEIPTSLSATNFNPPPPLPVEHLPLSDPIPPLLPTHSIPPTIQPLPVVGTGGDDMEDFVNDSSSLFGDSTVTSPIAGASSLPLPNIPTSLMNTSDLPIDLSLNNLLTSTATSLPYDQASITALLGSLNQPSSQMIDYSQLGMDLDLSSLGVDLNNGGNSGQVMDYELDLGDLPTMGEEELELLLKSLGGE